MVDVAVPSKLVLNSSTAVAATSTAPDKDATGHDSNYKYYY